MGIAPHLILRQGWEHSEEGDSAPTRPQDGAGSTHIEDGDSAPTRPKIGLGALT